jgi:hypothetical protein
MRRMLALCEAEDILKPQAAYGYWLAAGQGNDLVIFGPDGSTEVARFTLPRQPKEDGECIADFFRDVDDAERDVIALQIVTVGQKASDFARAWFEDNRYQDYLYLHGLSVEMAEAMAETAQAHPRRTGVRGRGRPRYGEDAVAGLSRIAVFVRLSGVSEARGSGADSFLARRGANRAIAVRGVPVASRAIDQRDRRAQSAREVFFVAARRCPGSAPVRDGWCLVTAAIAHIRCTRQEALRRCTMRDSGWRPLQPRAVAGVRKSLGPTGSRVRRRHGWCGEGLHRPAGNPGRWADEDAAIKLGNDGAGARSRSTAVARSTPACLPRRRSTARVIHTVGNDTRIDYRRPRVTQPPTRCRALIPGDATIRVR